MDRRRFLTQTGIGAAAALVGGVATGAEVSALDRSREVGARERQDGAGNGRGTQRIWWSRDTTDKLVALTFDDGPHPELTPRVLRILATDQVRATFFMIGRNAVDHPTIARDVVAAGHEVANHSWEHRRVVQGDDAGLREEIIHGARALHEVTGVAQRWFRPPRGMVTGRMLIETAAADHELVLWSVTRGGPAVHDEAGVAAHLSAHLHPGAIVDLHDGTGRNPRDARLLARRHTELAALPAFLDRTAAAGYRFVRISELLTDATRGPSGPP